MALEVRQTEVFASWLAALRDLTGRARILARLDRLALGLPGDVKAIGSGLSELRVPVGPGYRVYYMQRGEQVVILLCGGDKSSQRRDIARAKAMAKELEWRDGT